MKFVSYLVRNNLTGLNFSISYLVIRDMGPEQSGVSCQFSASSNMPNPWQVNDPEALGQPAEHSRKQATSSIATSSKTAQPLHTAQSKQCLDVKNTLLNSVFNQLSAGILLIDANNHQIVEANVTLATWLGYSKKELLEFTLDQLLELSQENFKSLIETLILQEQNRETCLIFRCKDESHLALKGQGNLITNEEQTLICWLITEPHQADPGADAIDSWQQTPRPSAHAIALHQAKLFQAAQKQVETLEYINQLKDNFLSTISHELRTPIATIKMAIQMLTLALGQEGLLHPPSSSVGTRNKIAHYLKILNDECNREIALITDLLDLQRLESGTHSVNVQLVSLKPYLERIIRPFQEQAHIHDQTLQLDIPENLPSVISDIQSLERILVELLTNACKYSPCGATIILKALPSEDSTGLHTLILSVCNSGVEIPQEQLSQIFEKFYRIPDGDPHRYSGTGLGLALVRKLSMNLGGKVSAESSHGKTCFTLEIPQVFQGPKPPGSSATPVEW